MKRNSLTSLFLAVLVMPGALHAQEEAIVRREAVTTTASIAHYMIADCVKEAKLLKKDIDGFVAAPSEINLGKAKLSWTNARLPFLQVRNLLWVETEGAKAGSHRGKFDGRPVDLKAINALIEDEAGYPKIDAAAVRKAAGKEGAGRMTGLSAIETLMWLTGNEDHVPFLPTTPLAKRRGACLAACAQIYLDDMKALAAEFDPAKEGNTHAAWKAADPEEMMATIMTAQAKFVARELVVKRLEKQDKAYFPSRTSRTDIQHGVAGIANVLAGACYGTDGELKVQGTGLIAAVEAEDKERGEKLLKAINDAMVAARRLPRPLQVALESDPPKYNDRIVACRDALKTLAVELAK